MHDGACVQEFVESVQFARQLGYLMFFRLKRDDAALTISERAMHQAEKDADLRNAHTWRLFNRDGDLSSTLQEFMDGAERVYCAREMLAKTLSGNVAVLRQVGRGIGIVLAIVWVFLAAWLVDPDAVQRTWTALSAGLLSFSFIFSNTIREVRHASLRLLDACVLKNDFSAYIMARTALRTPAKRSVSLT